MTMVYWLPLRAKFCVQDLWYWYISPNRFQLYLRHYFLFSSFCRNCHYLRLIHKETFQPSFGPLFSISLSLNLSHSLHLCWMNETVQNKSVTIRHCVSFANNSRIGGRVLEAFFLFEFIVNRQRFYSITWNETTWKSDKRPRWVLQTYQASVLCILLCTKSVKSPWMKESSPIVIIWVELTNRSETVYRLEFNLYVKSMYGLFSKK